MTVLDDYLIAEIAKRNREIRLLEKEIELYQRMLAKLRKQSKKAEAS